MEDTAAENLAHAAVRLVRPGPDDWEALDLPSRLEGLYYLTRPFRLMVRIAHMGSSPGGEAGGGRGEASGC